MIRKESDIHGVVTVIEYTGDNLAPHCTYSFQRCNGVISDRKITHKGSPFTAPTISVIDDEGKTRLAWNFDLVDIWDDEADTLISNIKEMYAFAEKCKNIKE